MMAWWAMDNMDFGAEDGILNPLELDLIDSEERADEIICKMQEAYDEGATDFDYDTSKLQLDDEIRVDKAYFNLFG